MSSLIFLFSKILSFLADELNPIYIFDFVRSFRSSLSESIASYWTSTCPFDSALVAWKRERWPKERAGFHIHCFT